MANRFQTESFTSASVSASSSLEINRTGLYNHMDIARIKCVPNSASDFTFEIYKDDGFTTLIYKATNVSNALYDPMDYTSGSPAEGQQGFLIPYDDDDDSRELHIKITNLDSGSAHTYDVEVDYVGNAVFAGDLTVGPDTRRTGDSYISKESGDARMIIDVASATDTDEPSLALRKSAGTLASPSVCADGDNVGEFLAESFDGGSDYLTVGRILFEIDGTPTGGGNRPPGRIRIGTGVDSGGTPNAVVIDSAQAVQFAQYGAGTLVTDSSGNITASSDGRLKDIQRDYQSGLAEVLQLQPKVFKWKPETRMESEQEYVGFIAEDVERVLPDAIGTDPHGYRTMSDRSIIAALVNAVKTLEARVAVLEGR